MTIQEVINELIVFKEKHGNLEVYVLDAADDGVEKLNTVEPIFAYNYQTNSTEETPFGISLSYQYKGTPIQ